MEQFDLFIGLVPLRTRAPHLTHMLVFLRFLVLVSLLVVGVKKRLLSDVPNGRELKLGASNGCSGLSPEILNSG